MKKPLLAGLLSLFLYLPCFGQSANLRYTIDLNDRSDDTFKVSLDIKKLRKNNKVYQFAATAPGTYQTMNVGRFVSDFKAFDKKGREISTTKKGDNQWVFSKPKKVKKITYQIAETWDTPVEKNPIYHMCGTSIEKDHVLINPHAVIGYPSGMQAAPLTLKLEYPEHWKVGTALSTNKAGAYYSKTYDHAVDSPILLGRLSKASTNLNGTTVEIYTYSKTDLIKSEQLLNSMSEMLKAAGAFIVDFPVDRYTFLFHFEDIGAGAWEHSYSSEYVMPEVPFTEEFGKSMTDIAAHEFFHVITPLNIHSEIIEPYNFVTPTPSEHLWLYEGTTEWAAHMMQLRYGLINLDQYLQVLSTKLDMDDQFDPNYSLSDLALNSFSEEGQAQYPNIYMRGALVAGLLDIKLLELSDGKRGLREVINELSKKYGPNKTFPENDFFNIFTQMTYPVMADFFENYVKQAKPLPIEEYYDKIGIHYTAEKNTGEIVPSLGAQIFVPDGKIRLMNVHPELVEMGLRDNDEIAGLNGTKITFQNAQQVLGGLSALKIGDQYTLTVNREEKSIDVICKILSREQVIKHGFSLNEKASEKQISLRERWMKNQGQLASPRPLSN